MRWIEDSTGRFPQRPWFEQGELDTLCEEVIRDFLTGRHGSVEFPISTDDLTVLVERHTSDLDIYADLSDEGNDVDGVTYFTHGKLPIVRIDRALGAGERWGHENRLRTTLTHEFGHVKFHGALMAVAQAPLFPTPLDQHLCRCHRETITGAAVNDWMEWQAGYASGAFLMPISPLRGLVQELRGAWRAGHAMTIESPFGQDVVRQVQNAFSVSRSAARVRLSQTGLLVECVPAAAPLW